MLDAQDAEAALKALTYPSAATANQSERAALYTAYNAAVAKITGEFREWLASWYASALPAPLQDKIWEKAWSAGHHAGYHAVEKYYVQCVEFAEFAINAVK
jgi:hypothetical protein